MRFASSLRRMSLCACSTLAALAGCSNVDDVGQTGPSTTGQEGTSGPASTTSLSGTGEPTTTDPTGPSNTTGIDSDTAGTTMGVTSGTSGSSSTSGGTEASTGGSTGDASSSGTTGMLGPDGDGDGAIDESDNCVDVANPDQANSDGDALGDACDNCPNADNPGQEDLDMDMQGDVCDDDDDNDGKPDMMDNCALVPNADQKDTDGDMLGDVCDDDLDGDSIPNPDDLFPNDKNMPGVVVPYKIYAHTSSTLYTVDVMNYAVSQVTTFKFSNDGCDHSVTDVAIDRWGVLYGITFGCAYVIHPQTAQATKLGSLPQSFNGLTMVPKGVIDQNKDTLIGISNAGGWYQLTLMNGVFNAKLLGTYGAGYTSAGDAFSIEGVGTYAAVNKQGVANATVIVDVDPATGKVKSDLATLNGYPTVYGLAGWEGLILAFDSSGNVIKVDPMTKQVTPLGNKGAAWWGAGVGTVLPQ